MATWNLRSLFTRGALQSTLEDLKNFKIQIAAVQETRWLDSGIHAMLTHCFYFSGNTQNKHEFGTGFIVDKSIDHAIIGFMPINKYMCTLRMKTKKFKVTILNVHAPTETKEDDIKDSFYSEMERVLNAIPTSDVKVIMGDFNAQIGREDCFRSVAGRHSLHDSSNDNGCRVANFAMSNGFVIKSTQFQRKDIYKVSWTSNDGRTQTQIDHVLIDGNFSNNIINVRSHRGTLHESDHALVKIVMRAKWPRRNVGSVTVRPKYNVYKLNDEETRSRYQRKIEHLIGQHHDIDADDNEMVRQNTIIIQEAAEEILGRATRSQGGEWFDEECKIAVEERKVMRLGANTRSKVATYKRHKIQVYRLLRKKKRDHLNQQIENLEAHNSNGNVRDFYKIIKKQRNGFQPKSLKINDTNGQLLSDTTGIAKRWKEYFQELLNRPTIQQRRTPHVLKSVEPLVETPAYEEVVEAVQKLKPNKSPGEDNIPAELIKSAGADLWHRLHRIIIRVWDEEKVPDDWLMGLLIPIFKKGVKVECKNYRGICLLNASYKVLAEILFCRLETYAEDIIGEYQGGFRRGRSTTDQIFTIRQIMEKAWEFNITIHQLFVDFKQAYDSIERPALFAIMEEFGFPKKLINLTKATLTDTKCKVLIQNITSEPFDITTGLRQGDKLSTILFNLALEKVIRAMTINWNGTIFNTSKQLVAFADDADLIGRGTVAIKEMFVEMEKEAEPIGLNVSEDKTKYLTLDRKHGSRIGQNITIDEYNFEVVQSFKYLGSIVNVDNDIEEEVKTRLSQGNRCFYALKHLFRNTLVSRNTKLRLYKTLIRPIVMYACETWSLTQKQEAYFNCFERRVLRSICGPINEQGRWRIRTNRELTEIFGEETILGAIKSARLRWAGHVARMDESRMPKKALERVFDNNRARGRPRKRWLDGVEEDTKKLGVREWSSLSQDRVRWRTVVESAKTRLG
jgi:hypothetical protein